MKIISTKLHGALDYTVGLTLATSPWLFGFYRNGAETWIPVVLGGSTILYSLFTNYEAGVIKKLPMPFHLTLDLLGALFLAISPWIAGFSRHVWLPHLTIAVLEMTVVLLTYPEEKSVKRPYRITPESKMR
ncbi:SPW repeat protein [Terrimonas sp. NA20]|uniref:SPW repeat protein n=1 Tax=Terrimonas ginsenosidimutans TaxID=2908004 RepID=A0ABS9KS46_9BACT|nr:SPW repeat protein [Terrimonas ginsenosidimutans]MCG2615141.1 SPW repeat protein [Terrimonas ginsenosidimutans]